VSREIETSTHNRNPTQKRRLKVRLIKMLGLAAVAAIAAMAFLGAGTASAHWCKIKETSCSAGNQYPIGTKIALKSTSAKLTGTLTTECASLAELELTEVSGTELKGKITSLSFTNCTIGCVATVNENGTFDDKATTNGNGTALILGVKVTLTKCLGFGTCVAKGADVTMNVTGGAVGVAQATALEQPVAMSGIGCGESGTWDAGGGSGGQPYVLESINGVASGSIFIE
jgi:hypothetical protein